MDKQEITEKAKAYLACMGYTCWPKDDRHWEIKIGTRRIEVYVSTFGPGVGMAYIKDTLYESKDSEVSLISDKLANLKKALARRTAKLEAAQARTVAALATAKAKAKDAQTAIQAAIAGLNEPVEINVEATRLFGESTYVTTEVIWHGQTIDVDVKDGEATVSMSFRHGLIKRHRKVALREFLTNPFYFDLFIA